MNIDEHKLQIILEKLKDVARKKYNSRGVITYSEAGDWASISGYGIQMSQILGEISKREFEAGRPLMSVLVILKDKSNQLPSGGFIEYMAEIGAYTGANDEKSKNIFIANEMKKCWAYWAAH